MPQATDHLGYRRRFLKFLVASPLFALSGRGWFEELLEGAEGRTEITKGSLISAPNEALNVFDFEAVAQKKLPAAHFGYMTTGVDDDATLRANREGFAKLQI